MNFHSDEWIMDRVREHYNEVLEYFPEDRIVGLFYAGSGNYGLDTPSSDVDTKLCILPTFQELAMNKQPISTTHVRSNNEHIDFKDVRLFIQLFKKQNLAFLETLFTSYCIINPTYQTEWDRLVAANEAIAHYNPYKAVKTMKGQALAKFEAIEHDSPSHHKDIIRFEYSPKEFHHLLRIEEYLERYISGELYCHCLKSKQANYLKQVKMGCHTLDEARWLAKVAIERIDKMADQFTEAHSEETNEEIAALLDDVQYNIMKIAIEKELGRLNE